MKTPFRLFIVLLLSSLNTYAQNLNLEELWLKGGFRVSMVYDLNWSPDGKSYTELRYTNGENILQRTNLSGNIYNWVVVKEKQFDGYLISPDTNTIAFWYQEEPVYRRSSRYHACLFNRKTNAIEFIGDSLIGKISNLSFSPGGKKLSYVKANNLYIYDIATKKETAITSDGKFNFVINGATDWVYEEEFEFAKAYVWSADGKYLSWYRFDESAVKEYNMQYFNDTYPTDYRFKYPKAGEANSVVRLFTYNTITRIITDITPSEEKDLYYPRLYATKDERYLVFYEMNRQQNHLKIHRYDLQDNKTELMYEEKNNTYIEVNDFIDFLPESSAFVFTSERDGFRHLWKIEKGKEPLALTAGNWEVNELYGIYGGQVYYASNEESSIQQKVYSIDLKTKKKVCLTKKDGWNQALFSSDFSLYLHTWSALNVPPVVTLRAVRKSTERVIYDNKALKDKLAVLKVPQAEFLEIPTDTVKLNAWMLKPKNFDAKQKYPVMLTVYGGPGAQNVEDQWGGANFIWFQILADKGYIVLAVDGRGTGAKGAAFKKCTQNKLGQIECDDVVKTARYLSTHAYIDSTRIGIFGWSFGGYLSAMAITRGAPTFKAAIAVAPVTDWKFYDNIYTERYMNTPQLNPKGYEESSVLTYAKNLSGNLLLIHGTGDDNVHIQHSYALQEALVAANKQFQSFYYPNRNHGIYGGYTRFHLFKMMTDFIEKNL